MAEMATERGMSRGSRVELYLSTGVETRFPQPSLAPRGKIRKRKQRNQIWPSCQLLLRAITGAKPKKYKERTGPSTTPHTLPSRSRLPAHNQLFSLPPHIHAGTITTLAKMKFATTLALLASVAIGANAQTT